MSRLSTLDRVLANQISDDGFLEHHRDADLFDESPTDHSVVVSPGQVWQSKSGRGSVRVLSVKGESCIVFDLPTGKSRGTTCTDLRTSFLLRRD